jgi:hypothetical protein
MHLFQVAEHLLPHFLRLLLVLILDEQDFMEVIS